MPIIQGILYGSVQRGVKLSELCAGIGLSEEDLGDSEFKVPFAQVCRTWEICARLTRDDLIGLHVGELSTMSLLGLVGNLMQSCPHLLSAFERMIRYIDLSTDMIQFGVEQHGQEIALSYRPRALWQKVSPTTVRHSMEQSMVGTLHVFSLLTGKKITPLKTIFSHKRAGELSEYHRILGTQVEFGGKRNLLVFNREDLLSPILSGDRSLFLFFENILKEKLTKDQINLTDQVKVLIRRDFHGQIPALETIASHLHMTPRTLQRKLAAENTSFRDVLLDVQKEIATQLFKLHSSSSQVAELLGYSDPSAFRRAFRKWKN